jgi:hypothetical protein
MTNSLTLKQITSRLHVLDKRGTTDVLEIGALLIEAKERLAAGNEQSFTGWLHGEFAWSHRTADRFMRARKWYDEQTPTTRHCVESGLTTSALYVISAEGVPAAAQREILKLAKEQRVGGTRARAIVQEFHSQTKTEQKPETKNEKRVADSAFNKAIQTLLQCDPQALDLKDLSAPTLIRAAEILTTLARRLRDDDAVQLAADRAEARAAISAAKAPLTAPQAEVGLEDAIQPQYCRLDHSAEDAVPEFLCRSGLPHPAPTASVDGGNHV